MVDRLRLDHYVSGERWVPVAVRNDDGGYVLASDYDALAAQLAEAQRERDALRQIRRWLKEGATIRATDPTGPVLEVADGAFQGGLTISYMDAALERT